jgi:pimeloyl-ACP methyl ester carboxylesterase
MEVGDPDGWPTIGFHGTPGSRLQLALDGVVRDAGIRLVLPDRPGYGLSTFQPDRRLTDWPRDVSQLADHLGIERFSVLGVSGGGPHSAVCAALLEDRVVAAAIVSGVAPLLDPTAAEGMMPANRAIAALARRRSRLLRVLARLQVEGLHRWPDKAIDMMLKQLPPSDVTILTRPEIRALFVEDAVHMSRDAGRACAQDFELFAAPWGFELGAISVPVHLWQGDADRNVPPSHGSILRDAIPGAVLHECPGEGHFLVVDRIAEIATAITPARPATA